MSERRGYVLVNVRFHDRAAATEYGRRVAPVVARYEGRYLVRGGASELVEGASPLGYLVLIEFPSLAAAKTWYDSPEYRQLRELRRANADSELTFVEGVASGD